MPVEIDIEHVARLARLELTDEEKARLRDAARLILEHAAKVSEVATDDVPPTAYAIPRSNVLRPTRSRPSLTDEEALSNAPESRTTASRSRGSWRSSDASSATVRGASSRPRCARGSARRSRSSTRAARASTPSTNDGRRVPRAHATSSRASRRRRLDALIAAGRRTGGGRHPARAEGRAVHAGVTTTCGSKILETYVPPYDCTRVGAPRAGRRRAGRQDQLRRVRDGLVERELGVRAGAQPVGPRHGPRRFERWLRRRGRRRGGRVGARDRHRRLGAPARVALRAWSG